jgi:hypothetical protein
MGTPGHMAHPFDVDKVKTGQDLIDYINDAVLRLQNQEIAGSVKWDGINTSFKLVTKENGEKDFRMDRGTNHTDSVVGLTADDAYAKWPEGHGMPRAIEKLLNIFNTALPLIEPELKELRMWDDPTKYFNTEYIEGKSNVQEYAANILAIHSINQFYEKKAQPHAIRKGTSMDRPGLPRPIDPATDKPIKGGGIEIPYSKEALVSLIEKVQPLAAEAGFEIYGDVPVEFDPEVELDLDAVLDAPISVQITPGGVATNTLREWLQMIEHPQERKITKSDEWIAEHPGPKHVGALSKDTYMAVLKSATDDGVPLSQYLESQEDVKDALNGALMYHGTRLLGQAVKNALTSAAGGVGGHEGVVLRGMEEFLVKLTGDFIIQGLASTHGDTSKQGLTENLLNWARNLRYSETLITEQDVERIAAVAGGFKPPHKGHLEMIKHYASIADKVKLFIGASSRPIKDDEHNRSISAEQSMAIWAMYLEDAGLEDKVDISIIEGSPMKAAYSVLENAIAGQIVLMGCGAKDTYFSPEALVQYTPEGVSAEAAPCPTIINPETKKPYKAEQVRATIKDNKPSELEKFLPPESANRLDTIFAMLSGHLDEESTTANNQGGAFGAKGGPWHGLNVKKANKEQERDSKRTLRQAHEFISEEDELVNEVVDYLLGITVG